MKKIIAIASTLAIAACAQSPGSIQPVSMGDAYSGVSCQSASARLITERQSLAALESKQKAAVAGDAMGVFLLGIPVSSLTGQDVSGEIAASKGRVIALEARAIGC